VSIPGRPQATLRAPYDPETDRYVIEIWGRDQNGLRDALGARGQAAVDGGSLVGRPDLVSGTQAEFDRMAVDGRDMRGVSNGHTMHPILPLYLDVTWTAQPDGSGATDGPHRLGFEMLIRGWDNYLAVGFSGNPHGGVGTLEYRTLLSNYGAYQESGELSRVLEPWNFDAHGNKGHASGDVETFMTVDYMDLHVLEPACGIGLHRHRDNQEIFFMLDGEGIMVIGDWADSGRRTRSFEVRRLAPGHFAMLKGGNLHGLMNPADVPNSLFMFGGYD
jgi:mannose-6-phosphate isomerase-like protein (cupin superfamily)